MLHSRTLAALDEFELVAVVARREESLAAAQPFLPGVPGFLRLEQALAETAPEAWVVACSTSQHLAVTRRLLESGGRVLLEKPIAESLAEARQLADLVEPGSSRLMLGHIVLFNSEFAELLITFGSMGIPASEWCRLFSANRLSEPPLCSKKAQNSTENRMNTSAARMRLFWSRLNFRISQPR